ncbi:MAG TPA: SDR family oxidoreductase [Puia sp.]
MKIVIFGASGHIGQILVACALEKGYTVTAFVRNPKSIEIKNKNFSIHVGDIGNYEQVADAVKGNEAVISVVGNRTSSVVFKSTTVISEGLENIIKAMKQHKVKRLLFVTSFGLNESMFLPQKIFIRTVLRNIFAQMPRQEKIISQSGLDYTIVRPARLTDEPSVGEYNAAEDLYIGPFSHISRTAVADFLLQQIESKKFLRRIVTIAY